MLVPARRTGGAKEGAENAEKTGSDIPARRRHDHREVRGGLDRRGRLRRHPLQGGHQRHGAVRLDRDRQARALTGMTKRRDGGMAIAELAVVLPALVLVVAAGLAMVSV